MFELAADGKQLVLGRLVEDVVDDLNRVDQPGLQGLEHVGRLPPIDADADARISPWRFRSSMARCQRSSWAQASSQT